MVSKKLSPKVKKQRPKSSRKKKTQKKVKSRGKVKELVVKKRMSDEKIAKKEGEYFSTKDFPIIVKEDCDVYAMENGKKKLLGKFRKGVIGKNLTKAAMENLKEAAQ